jgi:ribonuclease HI
MVSSTSIKSIYTDASSLPTSQGGIGVGAGFTVFENTPREPIYSQNWNIGDQQIVYNGELDGITRAIEYASSIAQIGDHFDIYSDNQAGIQRLARISDNPGQESQIRVIEASNRIVSQGATITINWVLGHEDILGNETADTLAKEATKKAPESNSTSFALLGLKIQELRAREWARVIQDHKDKRKKAKDDNPTTYSNTYDWRIGKKLALPQGVNRQIASSFYQLKIGHGYLKSYLHRIKRANNPDCLCGHPETTNHLLLSCNKLKDKRSIIRESLGTKFLSLPLLLHTAVGIEKALGFLKSTRICSRVWHLERNNLLNEELDP